MNLSWFLMFWVVVFVGSTLIQTFLIIFVFAGILFYREKANSADQNTVSVIICAHNEVENLKVLIPELFNQEYPFYEVIVVDDRSTDGSEKLLHELKAHYPNLKLISIDHIKQGFHPKKFALTQGIQAAQNELILLTDADCRPQSTHWIREMQQSFAKNTDIVLGFSPYFKQKGLLNAFIQYETFYTAVQYFSLALVGMPYMGVGRNLAYRKSIFLQNNGLPYRQVTGGDDDLWINQIANAKNVQICLRESTHVRSIPKNNWHSWYLQKIRHLSVSVYYRLQTKIILGIINASQVLFWLSFLIIIFAFQEIISWKIITGGFFLRMGTLWLVFTLLNQKIHAQVSSICIPFFDFFYVFYIFIVGVIAISKRHIQWN